MERCFGCYGHQVRLGIKLDYISISNSLQTFWDEQLGSSRHAMIGQRAHMNNWHEQWDVSSDWHDTCSDDWYSWASHVAEHTWPEAAAAQEETSPAEQADDPADPDLQEALDAERLAEALMSEARRTWSQAQQATAMLLRKDRGFGKASGSASTTDNRGCFTCGSFQHYSRDCPDRGFTQKGCGKYLSPAELESYLKGKKGQNKSKDGMWMEDYYYDAYPLQKGMSGK